MLHSLGILGALVVIIATISTFPKITGTARLVSFCLMLLAATALLFLFAGVHTL